MKELPCVNLCCPPLRQTESVAKAEFCPPFTIGITYLKWDQALPHDACSRTRTSKIPVPRGVMSSQTMDRPLLRAQCEATLLSPNNEHPMSSSFIHLQTYVAHRRISFLDLLKKSFAVYPSSRKKKHLMVVSFMCAHLYKQTAI